MPNNISTTLNEFVNENISKTKRVNKTDVKIAVLECLSKSDKKLNMSEISKITGFKTDNIYVAITEIKEAKSKKINDISYWYINESQVDPAKKVVVGAKAVDPIFMQIYEDDKNNPSGRKIFLSMEEHKAYVQKQNGTTVKPREKKTATKGVSRTRRKK